MTARLFVAVVPPPDILDDLDRYAEPRRAEDSPLRWTRPDSWHLTLAFTPSVPDHADEEFVDRLHAAASRHRPFELQLRGAGSFPVPFKAKVLWTGVAGELETLAHLAAATRAAAATAGLDVDGARFRPHLTLARLNAPQDVTRWLRAFELFESRPWQVTEFELIESNLGAGPSGRYRTLERFSLPVSRSPREPDTRR